MIEIFRNTGNFEALLVMARLALLAEFPLMHILVTNDAISIFNTEPVLKHVGYRHVQIMAVLATDRLVLPRKGKSCFVVIEFVVQNLESLLCMALLAVVTQFVLVYILMAAVTIGKGYSRKALKLGVITGLFRVTFYTAHVFVLPGQRIMCLFVSESGCRCKVVGSVALGAIHGKCALVHILMTVLAVLAESQICFRPLFDILILNQVGFMAFPAINRFVFAGKFETCSEVVESFFIKTHHVEVPAVVVAVTVGALFVPGFLRSMEAPVPVDEILNVLMAG